MRRIWWRRGRFWIFIGKIVFIIITAKAAKYSVDGSRHHSAIVVVPIVVVIVIGSGRRSRVVAAHGIRLSGGGLSVGENGGVESSEKAFFNHRRDAAIKHSLLIGCRRKREIKGEASIPAQENLIGIGETRDCGRGRGGVGGRALGR